MITERDGEIAMRRLVGFLMAVCMVIGLLLYKAYTAIMKKKGGVRNV